MKSNTLLLTLMTVISFSRITLADLEVRGMGSIVSGGSGQHQLIYDTELGITWLDYSNGGRNWETQNAWASSLEVSFDGTTYDDWRLPQMLPLNGVSYNWTGSYFDGSRDRGFNISAPGSAYPGTKANEFAHLFYTTLGNVGRYDLYGNPRSIGWSWDNVGPFLNLTAENYWIGTDCGYSPQAQCRFVMDGNTDIVDRYIGFSGMAVMEGDISSVVPIPAPGAILLGTLGAGLVGWLRRRRTL